MKAFSLSRMIPPIIKRSLAGKFIFITTLVIIIGTASLTYSSLRKYRVLRHRQLRNYGFTLAKNLASECELPVLTSHRSQLKKLAREIVWKENVLCCRIDNLSGEVLAHAGKPLPPADLILPPPNTLQLNGLPSEAIHTHRKDGKTIDWYRIVVPVVLEQAGGKREEMTFPPEDQKKQGIQSSPQEAAGRFEEITFPPNGKNISTAGKKKIIGAIYLGISTAGLNREITNIEQTAFTLAFFTIILSILAITVLTQIVTRPIEKLIEGTGHISRGDLSYQVKLTSSDEIGTLTRSFNLMTKALRQYREKLQNYSQTLEEKVDERTRALRLINEELRILNQVTSSIGRSINLDQTLLQIVGQAPKVIEGNNCFILLYNKEKKELYGVAGSPGIWPEVKEIRIKEEEPSGSMIALHKRKIIAIKDAARDPRLTQRLVKKFNQKSLISAPLLVQNQAIGVLIIDDTRRIRQFTASELERVQIIANQAASAIYNSRLYTKLQKSLQELKDSQGKLIRSEKFAVVGELLTGITHEINNQLVPILGYAEILQLNEPDDEKLKMLKMIEDAALGSKAIIESLLTFAQPQKPKKRYQDINQILQETIKLLSYKINASGIIFKVDLDKNLPATMVDSTQIGQVFLNIINNAQQAMEASQKPELTIISYRDKDFIKFKFTDTGPGITPEVKKRIFDPFFSTKRPGKGSGLGLSVSYQIIKSHQGEIELENNPQGGAVFTVSLPVINPPAKEQPSPEPAPEEMIAPGGQILVVDDEEATVSLMADVLSPSYQVETALTGEEAWEKLTRKKFDLIVIDIRMPGIGGKEIYQQLKKEQPGEEEKLIFITGDTFEPKTREFLRKTGNPFLLKPFRMEDLRKVMARRLNSNNGKIA